MTFAYLLLGNIGDYAFAGSSTYYSPNITTLTLPDGLLSIGASAFGCCDFLSSINIPDSVTSIGLGAFEYCDKLAYNVNGSANYLGNDTRPYLVLVKVTDADITSFSVPAQTRFIYGQAFSDCMMLRELVIPDTVESISPSLTAVFLLRA